ncbi:APC family permease [Acidocella sp.]|uniref:APC family permease n=1 Tax=Acidocella sp. TaxID=50710 RepID=UPI00261E9BE0|nr:APC family permease [Acidocella sp.]
MEGDGLKRNALGIGDAIIIGLSSSGPAQTMAVSLAGIVAASGYAGILPILISFIPMLGIAIAYQRLNRWDQSSGATYSWVARSLNPMLGFLAGWMILLYYTVGTSSLTIPCGTYTLQLLAPHLVNNNLAVGLVGAAWDILVTLLALCAIRVAARFEWMIAIFEYLILGFFALLGIVWVFTSKTAVPLSADWFTIKGAGGVKGLVAGILIACFMYSGWDAAVYVNEETHNPAVNPGRAAIASVVILAIFYSVATFGFQGVLSGQELQANAGNALAVIANRLLPGPWSSVMSLVVLTGTIASLQAAVISAARIGFAMANDRVMPTFFRLTSPRSGSPYAVTIFMGAINLIFLALSLFTSGIGSALSNIVSALGLIALLFYGLTAFTAIWCFRRELHSSLANFFLGGVLPGVGVIFSVAMIILSITTGATNTIILIYGLGSIIIGALVALFLRFTGKTGFFRGEINT